MDTQVPDVQHGQEPPMCMKHSAAWENHRKQQLIQDWEPWFPKATRYLVSILTTFQDSEGSSISWNFGGISYQALKMKTDKITDVKLWAECSQMDFTWVFAWLVSSHFLSQTYPVFCPIYLMCLHIKPEVAMQVHFYSDLYLLSPSEWSKCFGNAYLYFFSNTETIQQEDKSLIPLSSMCLWTLTVQHTDQQRGYTWLFMPKSLCISFLKNRKSFKVQYYTLISTLTALYFYF